METEREIIINILKEKYTYENERKRYYDNVITLPVSLLAFIVTGIYVILNETAKVKWFEDIKPFCVYPLLASTIISMFFLYRVFFGLKRKYCSFPSTTEVLGDYEKIKAYYVGNKIKHSSRDIQNDLDSHLIKWYSDINDNNIVVNDLRAANFHNSKIFIGISYLLGILVFGLYCDTKINYNQMSKSPTVQTPPPPPKPSPSPVRREKSDQIPIKTK